MSTIVEHYTSGEESYSGQTGTIDRVYHVLEATSGYAAREAVRLATPAIDPDTNFIRKTISTSPKGAGIYECKVKYSNIENKVSLKINAKGEKIKFTRALEEIGNYKVRDLSEFLLSLSDTIDANETSIFVSDITELYEPPFEITIDDETMLVTEIDVDGDLHLTVVRGHNGTTQASHLASAGVYVLEPGPSFGGLINVGKDKVDGVDWYVPSMKITMQWSSNWGTLEPDYVEMVSNSAGKTNDEALALTIKGQQYYFAIGEVVSLGGTFSDTASDGADITLDFEIQRRALVSIGERDGSNTTYRTKIMKEGWEFGWLRTARVTTNNVQVDVPNSFHLSRVGEPMDFGLFGIFDTIVDE